MRNGKYLYWFHNHGGRFIGENPHRRTMAYEDRNPAWLCGGVEGGLAQRQDHPLVDTPEIVLYDDDPDASHDIDFVEDGGNYYLTETQKNAARVHQVDPHLLAGLWSQFDPPQVAREKLLLELPAAGKTVPAAVPGPLLADFQPARQRPARLRDVRRPGGIQHRVVAPPGKAGRRADCAGKPHAHRPRPGPANHAPGTLEIVLNDDHGQSRWDCDPGVLSAGKLQHVVVTVDGGPKIVTFVVDGRLCDGGAARQFGWGSCFNPQYRGPAGDTVLRIAPDVPGAVQGLRIYGRALRTSEAVNNFRAGMAAPQAVSKAAS